MVCGTAALLFCVLLLCGLQEAAASPRGHCAEGLCSFQVLLDFPGAKRSCQDSSGKLLASKELKTITSLTKGLSGRFWLGDDGAGLRDCPAVSVTAQNITALSVPCRDKLDGYVCQYDSGLCFPLQANRSVEVKYATNTGYELVGDDMFPPGTLATVGGGKYPDAKHLCFSDWISAPWTCEVLNGGCEHSCSAGACKCPAGHKLHPNNFTCITDSCAACAQGCQKQGDSYVCTCDKGYRLAADGKNCEDVNECEEKLDDCTSEGEMCVNDKGGYTCECARDFEEEDGKCVNTSICILCEHKCDKINGVYRCACDKNFRVSREDPTKCERFCGLSECPAQCDRNPELEKKDMQQCFCPDGYIVERRNETAVCYDIDECEQQSPCDHRCQNTYGGYRCSCDDGFRLVDDECVKLDDDDERGSGSSSSSEFVTPADVQTPALPTYIKAGSVMGITLFLALGAALLLLLARKLQKRCRRFNLVTFKHPDIDIFYLQQVTTETYKRLSYDKPFRNDSQR